MNYIKRNYIVVTINIFMEKYITKTVNYERVNYYVDVVSKNFGAHCSGIKVSFSSTYNAEGKIKRLTEHPEDLKLVVAYLNRFDNTCSLVICQNEEDVIRTLNEETNVWRVKELWVETEQIVKTIKKLAIL